MYPCGKSIFRHLGRKLSAALLMCPIGLVAQDSIPRFEILPLYKTDTVVIVESFSLPSLQKTELEFHTLQNRPGETLADLLQQNSGIYIKSYGPGALATSSVRGGSASHVQVLWNGLPLLSPMNGQTDFNLLTLSSADRVRADLGGNAVNGGNGSITGLIRMDNMPAFNSGLQVGISAAAGSFGRTEYKGDFSLGGKKIYFKSRLWQSQAENNFSYKNTSLEGNPEVKQNNAEIALGGVNISAGVDAGKWGIIKTDIMWQQADRKIPPFMSQTISGARQQDENIRSALAWEGRNKFLQWKLRTGISRDILKYTDSLSYTQSDAHSFLAFADADFRSQFSRVHQIQWSIWQSQAGALSDGYVKEARQGRMAIIPGYKFQNLAKTLEFTLHLRQEWAKLNDTVWSSVPVLPALGVQWQTHKNTLMHFSASRVYRLPTLNDLYWRPGGNPALKPESGYNAELGFSRRLSMGKIIFQAETEVYLNYLENRIQWQPSLYYWQPLNIETALARGLEASVRADFKWSQSVFQIQVRYHVNRTTELDKPEYQLFYVPQNTGGAGISWKYKNWQLRYTHSYSGFVFTATDNSAWLNAWSTGDFRLDKSVTFRKQSIKIFAECRNLWNIDYCVMEGRPMPGRNMLAGLEWNFTSLFKN